MLMEIQQARMLFLNGGCSPERAANISRLTFKYVHAMAGSWPRGIQDGRFETGPLKLPLHAMSDDEVARATAQTILRRLAAGSRS